mgnify:CR=1 FL=1
MNIVLLKEKRDECMSKLERGTSRLYLQHFLSIYELVKKTNKRPRELLKEFQYAIRAISQWTVDDIKAEHKRFLESCEFFDTLVKSLFKLHLAIYNTMHDSDFTANIPNAGQYMHETYLSIARRLWKEPYLVYDIKIDKLNYQRNVLRLEKLIRRCLHETFVAMLPFSEFDEQLKSQSDEEEDYEMIDAPSEDGDVDTDESDVACQNQIILEGASQPEQEAEQQAESELEEEQEAEQEAEQEEEQEAEPAAEPELEEEQEAEPEQPEQPEQEAEPEQPEQEAEETEQEEEQLEQAEQQLQFPSDTESDHIHPPNSTPLDCSETSDVPLPYVNMRDVKIVHLPMKKTLADRKKLVRERVKQRGFPDFARPTDSFF